MFFFSNGKQNVKKKKDKHKNELTKRHKWRKISDAYFTDHEFSAVHGVKSTTGMSPLRSCWPARHWITHTHTKTHTNSCSLSSCYTICLDTGTRHTLFIHPAAWGCSLVLSALSRPGPSPSWSGCVSSAWLPWSVEIPPWPRCRTPGLSASAPVCASPLWPT